MMVVVVVILCGGCMDWSGLGGHSLWLPLGRSGGACHLQHSSPLTRPFRRGKGGVRFMPSLPPTNTGCVPVATFPWRGVSGPGSHGKLLKYGLNSFRPS